MTKKIYIGSAGWSYPDWKGIVYPQKMNQKETELEYISNYFNLVEVNSTFYRFISENIAIRWLNQVKRNETFQFTCKLLQNFTHQRANIDTNLDSWHRLTLLFSLTICWIFFISFSKNSRPHL